MLKIYLADLVYDSIKTNHVVPLNIAYLTAYIKKKYPREVDIKIFKYPKDLEKALKSNPPDILGLSNYSWNARLDTFFIKMAKRLNPNVITVMGGPNIKTEMCSIKEYLFENAFLDYYILYEGEEPFCNLVKRAIEESSQVKPPPGCATIVEGEFIFEPMVFSDKSKIIDLPSPYLTGVLDSFLTDSNMIPLLESNRGCPFGCVYCTWGIAALSKVRQRPLEVVYEEIDYIAEKSAGQVNWIFCDANFGLLPRDVDIAKKIREVIDRKGYPLSVTLWPSKNTNERNIEIAKILKASKGWIAIQSADPQVLKNSGREPIKVEDIKKRVSVYKKNEIKIITEVMIGLPGESAKSHLDTLITAFDIGFDEVYPYNIRMLPGSKYESEKYRKDYGVKTKYRPIFGAYGIYDEQFVFELEESVRSTKDMTEQEMDSFKVIHWLIYFTWNTGVFRPLLRFGQRYGVNPVLVFRELSCTNHALLREVFREMGERSMAEWFKSSREMIQFYEKISNFNKIMNNFAKLNFLYMAIVYRDDDVFSALLDELTETLKIELRKKCLYPKSVWDDLLDITGKLVCKNLLQDEVCIRNRYPGEVISAVFGENCLSKNCEIEIYRPQKYVDFCKYYLDSNGKRDFSLQNLCRFFEIGGIEMLTNKVRIIG